MLQFIKSIICTQTIFVVLLCLMFENDSEIETQKSAGTILCCLATASDKNVTISTNNDKYP